jgi:acyl phosphate:glycerol-3-phosphate acyltransferase
MLENLLADLNWGLVFILLGALVAYLLGSIPSAVWYGQYFHQIDIREHGSGNAGATNTFRVLGKKAGSIVMSLDVLKGFLATELAYWLFFFNIVSSIEDYQLYKLIFYKLIFGTLAIVGHIFPVFAGFKGGKGVATLLGMMLSVNYAITLMSVGVFIIVLLLSKYVSLGSMLAALSFPLLLLIPRFKPDDPILIVYGFMMFLVVLWTHQKNIKKLINGEENRANIRLRRR